MTTDNNNTTAQTSKAWTTAQIPPQFLRAAFMVGHVPQKALASDPRISYALYVPPEHYKNPTGDASTRGKPLPLLVHVHGTRRSLALMHRQLPQFADATGCAVVAPLYPAGLDGPNDLDSYKQLCSPSLRSDLALLSILEEIAHRWPGIATDKVYLMGFSGGGQFAHRFLYLHPERLHAVSVGAPGRVTLLDDQQAWPRGVADVEEVFQLKFHPERLREVEIQLVCGSEDVELHGSNEFRTWVQQHVKAGRRSGDDNDDGGAVPYMDKGRLGSLRDLETSWNKHAIQSQFDVVDGVAHSSEGVCKCVLGFLRSQIQKAGPVKQ
ncbi:hypothetical protein ASPZODRAFT_141300 [Penicilliopsis zonata CBS 506.65]|uniref:Carboxylic ester hydrolase n=1 Tax=Penicilliopsis zonata CBS 506.65 TaxID=1073090 RepID=A0A1L9SKJ2_9EURO|nr:hypothetical protein ASPZODRAFT_141300 [Penicilliopsis zonata CBS 506.65]OJJ47730.1 hypothetical protein ASPZODRAFT_141300 [Penicilliopsis zonata CBS 506.65]